MNKRTASLLVLVVLVSLCTFGSESQRNSTPATANQRAAAARNSAQKKSPPTAPPTNIGFLNPLRTAADGAIAGIFPAGMGDFKGDGNLDAVTMVNISPGAPHYSISAAINNGSGSFTTKLTATSEVQQNPIFVADLNGDGKDDVLLVHAADNTGTTYIQAWLSDGTGGFTAVNSGVPVTTNGFVWAGIADVDGDGCPDVVVADAATPNGNIWTLLEKTSGTCDGNFRAATSVPFTGALNAFGPGNTSGVPGNPIVFADFNGDKKLDFAAADAANNQIAVYLNNGAGYTGPTLLATPNSVYDSYCLGYGNLGSVTVPQGDLVSANGTDGNITVYVNNGSGVFATGVYYAGGARPAAVSVADVDGDGNPDVLVTDLNSAAIKVLSGNGDGTVNPPTVGYITGGNPLMPALVGNFSGASNPVDLLLPDNQTNFVYLQGYGDGSFRSGINYYSEAAGGGFQPEGVGLASGDFNGDGIPDFVIGNADCGACNHAAITVFISNADGSLQPGVNYSPSAGNYFLQFVAVADFNGDGKLDIAASDSYNGVIQVFPGNGDGTFGTPVTYPTGGTSPHPVGIVTADFNGDGKPDLAFVNNFGPANAPTTADVGILINNGTGGFNAVKNSAALSTVATELTAADVNGDNKLDLVVPLYGICSAGTCSAPGSAVAILLGNGDGTLQAESDFSLKNGTTTYLNPYDAAVADLNGDGKADLAVTIQNVKGINQGIAVALGNGDGTFQPPTLLASSPQNPLFVPPPVPGYVKIVDLNRDGHPDLVYTNAVAGTVGVMYGKGDGTFYTPLDFAANRWAWDFALADVNGDGVLDVVASGFEQSFSGVGVLLNSSGSSTALQSSSPHSGAGQSVTFTATITGSKVRGVTTTPSGTMTFFDGSTQLGQPVAISSGMAALSTSTLAVGSHNITAQYSGDTNYVPNTSAVLVQVVGQVGSSTSTPTSSANPSTFGQPVTFSATVSSAVKGDTFVPTGKVTFNDGTTALGTGTLNSSGVATFLINSLAVGSHSITAQYAGDANFTGSTSAVLVQVVGKVAGQVGSSTSTPTSSANPSTLGQPVTFSTTVSSAVKGDTRVPTGKVTFNDGTTALGIGILNSSGVATFPTSSLAVGKHSITAQYAGDTNFTGSTSSALSQVVAQGTQPNYSLTANPTSQTVNPGTAATFVITMTAVNGYNGTVSFPASACSGLPSGTSCSFSAGTITGSGTTTLTVSTTAKSAAMIAPSNVNPHPEGSNLWASLGGIGMFGMILAGDWKKRNRRRLGIGFAILAVVMIMALVGCGGGSSSSGGGGGGGGGGGTPAGSYVVKVSVTGTVNTTPHPLNLTLVVN